MREKDDILDPSLVAELIAQETEKWSNRSDYISPFAKHAHEHFYDFRGGKADDITVIVSQICLTDESIKKL